MVMFMCIFVWTVCGQLLYYVPNVLSSHMFLVFTFIVIIIQSVDCKINITIIIILF